MTQHVRIIEGSYNHRGEPMSMAGKVFPLAKDFSTGARGGYIMVDARGQAGFPDRNIKIWMQDADCMEFIENDEVEAAKETTRTNETDEEIIERLRDRFDMLTDMAKAVKRGDVRSLIVSGPPGVGKSHGIEEVLDRYQMVETLGGSKKYEVVKGAMSPIGLYCKLYKYADEDNVIVFDDCDSIFSDELALNILKAALDSKKKRMIHWNTDSFKLRNEGVPSSFMFKGSAIFITNLKFDKVKSKKIQEHLKALESRSHYIDLTIDTEREKMLRIKQIVGDGMLDSYNLSQEVKDDIVEFVDVNKKKLRELSLRTVLKVADLAKAFPDRWEAMAENTVMRRG